MSRADELVELIRGRIHSEFDGECHLTDTEAHAIADFLSEADQREREARRIALEDLRELLKFTKWTAYVYHCPPPRSKRDNPLKHSSLITLQGSHDSEEAALKAAKLAIGLGWVGGTIIHRETAKASAQLEIRRV